MRFTGNLVVLSALMPPLIAASCETRTSRIARNEESAITSMVVLPASFATFAKTDWSKEETDPLSSKQAWSQFLKYHDPTNGPKISLVSEEMLRALIDGTQKQGYIFGVLEVETEHDPSGQLPPLVVCAVPDRYEVTGRNVFILDNGGTVRGADAKILHPKIQSGDPVPPLTLYPSAAELETKWIAVGG